MLRCSLDILDASGKPDLQAVLDAAQDGDRVQLWPGVYTAPVGGFRITKRIELFGEGPGSNGAYSAAVLVPGGSNDDVLLLEPPTLGDLENLHLHDFRIAKPAGQAGHFGRHGIAFVKGGGRKLSSLIIERVAISGLSGTGFQLQGEAANDGAIVGPRLEGCRVEDCLGRGIYLERVFGGSVIHCLLRGNGMAGLRASDSEAMLLQCAFEGNDHLGVGGGEGNLRFVECRIARVDASRFSNFGSGLATACVFDRCGGGGAIGACYFEMPSFGGVGVSIVANPLEGPILVLPNRFRLVQTLVSVGDTATACVLMPQCDESEGASAGHVALPAASNSALVAAPNVSRPSGNSVAGLVLPSRPPSGDPSVAAGGSVAYDALASAPSVRADVGAGFGDIQLAPAKITDLAVTGQGKTSLVIQWTGLGAQSYALRRSTTPITPATFDQATPVAAPVPGDLGTYECVTDAGLTHDQTYYYAIKSVIEGTPSAMSDLASGTCSGSAEVECP